MQSSVFQFKEFAVRQRDSAMKVGTDGVLLFIYSLGAWTSCDMQRGMVLDIGTGTGLIALMLAQRYPDLSIDSIEIDKAAAVEKHAIILPRAHGQVVCDAKLFHLQEYARGTGKIYAHIVCNPPFFPYKNLRSYGIADAERDQARNQLFLPFM